MSRIHHVKLKGFFFLPLEWFWDFFSCSFWFLKSANYPLQSLFQTRPQTGGDSRCVFEESENMILQVSTLNFFLMMRFASRGFPAPSASQWKKRGKCLWRNVFKPGERRKKTFTDRSYSLFPLLNAKKHFVVLLPAAVWAFEVAVRLWTARSCLELGSSSASLGCIWATCQKALWSAVDKSATQQDKPQKTKLTTYMTGQRILIE